MPHIFILYIFSSQLIVMTKVLLLSNHFTPNSTNTKDTRIAENLHICFRFTQAHCKSIHCLQSIWKPIIRLQQYG